MVSETKALQKWTRGESSSFRGPDLKLYVRDVREWGKKRAFSVRSWGTIKDAKDAIQQLTEVPVSAQRLFFGPLMSSGKELPNHRSLADVGIHRSGEVLLLDIASASGVVCFAESSMSSLRLKSNDLCISTSLLSSTPKPLRQTITYARRAFALGIKPDLVMDGSGGSYYMHDAKKNKIGVFKPADEEPYAENNPRGYLPQAGQEESSSLRQGIAPGEACIREVAAFLLDHEGFADVPMTTLAEARHSAFNTNGARMKVSEGGASIGAHSITSSSNYKNPYESKKVGSFQEFVRSEGSMDDLSPSKLSVDQVHKIAILDIRLLNADRNPANLLCRRLPDNSLELVPIDHGYCLRSKCDVSWMDWCWLDWPQLKKPVSAKSKEYIQKLDIEADARILSERLNISEEAIDYLRASTAILKAGVEAGLSLYEIAVMCCRNDNLAEKPSLLEHLTGMASELAQLAVDNEDWHHSTASQALEEQLSSPSRPGPVTSRDRSSSRRFHRCASSGEFLSITPSASEDTPNGLSNLSQAMLGHEVADFPPPALAQSSGSDSSSDNEKENAEGEEEQVNRWAHGVIQDSFQNVVSPLTRNIRSGSLSSDDGSLSSSPKGFWHVRPGSVDNMSSDEEDASLQSFGTSSEETPLPLRRRQSVTFADPPATKHLPSQGPFLRPPTTVNVVSPLIKSDRQTSTASSNANGMPRSKSYTALSRSFSSSGSSSLSKQATQQIRATESFSFEDHEYFRTYFLKFIDLVIAREMFRRTSSQSSQTS